MKLAGDLALFGGSPTFERPLYVAQLNLPDWNRVERSFRDLFRRRYFANNGPLVQALDRAFADYLGVGHAVCVTNGTVGLMILARALELSGEVIVPAFTFPATAQAVSWAGLTPVLCDISPDTHMITRGLVAPLMNDKTAGVLGVHLWGRPCDPDALAALTLARGATLFYDACHAVGSSHNGRLIGGLGAAEVFSFHATKVLNAAEGGCITTTDPQLAERLRTLRNFSPGESFTPVPTRMNGKMSEAQAAMALLSLEDLPQNIAANRERYDHYVSGLAGVPGLTVMRYPANEANNYQYLIVEIAEEDAGLRRDAVMKLLAAENVLVQRHFYPGLHRTPPFSHSATTRSFPGTERVCERILLLPMGQGVSPSDVDLICALIRGIVASADEIRDRLR